MDTLIELDTLIPGVTLCGAKTETSRLESANRDLAAWTPDESDWFHAPKFLPCQNATRRGSLQAREIRISAASDSELGSFNRRRSLPLTILTQNAMIDGMKIELL
ncbi:MAG: hypothetical protein J2P21_11105 [Chloracidobacterium sp.]|nr:hypothetical protein [Chloracidobacterium sp.]